MSETLLFIYLQGLLVAFIFVGIVLGYTDAKSIKISAGATITLVVLAVVWPIWVIILLWEKFKK